MQQRLRGINRARNFTTQVVELGVGRLTSDV